MNKEETHCTKCNQYPVNCECAHPGRIEQERKYKESFKGLFKRFTKILKKDE